MYATPDDEGSFAAGRQSLLDALQSLEQRAHERAELLVRDAERTARHLTLESEQRAYQLTTESEERARHVLFDAEQRAKQATLDTAQRLAELEQKLSEVRDNLEAARAQVEEQLVSVRGQVEVARATLNTVRQQLTSSSARAPMEPQARLNAAPRPASSRLALEPPRPERLDDAASASPSLSDLRAAVDALKMPRREQPPEPPTGTDDLASADEPQDAARY